MIVNKTKSYFQTTIPKDHITLLAAINAGGKAYKPLLIFSGETIPSDVSNVSGIENIDLTTSPTGCITKEIKASWFSKFISSKE